MDTKQENGLDLFEEYKLVCNKILDYVITEYFIEEGLTVDDVDKSWVGEDIGGVAEIQGMFFDMYELVQIVECKPTEEQFFKYYGEYRQAMRAKGRSPITIKNYLKLELYNVKTSKLLKTAF